MKNLIDQVEKLVVRYAPDQELDVSITPPLGATHALPTSHVTITLWVIMCWVMWGEGVWDNPNMSSGSIL